jgi:hypothetical protein
MSVPFYVLLPDYARARVALVPEGNSFSLPQFSREEGIRYHTVATVNDAVLSTWHVPVTVSRCLVEGQNGLPATFALHNHDESWKLPPPATWIEVNRLKDLSFTNPEHGTAVLDWLSSEADESWRTVPWSSPMWFARATKWISDYVQSTGATLIGAPVQIRVWSLSCVLRVSTTAGTLYFKALPDFFGHEPVLMRYLSKHFPQYMMDVVATEPDEHWMLTREMSGPEPESKEDWHKVLQTLAEIQQHCDNNLDELLSLGCNDRRLALLPTELQPVLQELTQPQMRQLYGVTEAEAEELARRVRAVGELCDRLADCGIPDTLVHGDLWGPNVIFRDPVSGKSPIIFDWTDAAISHPFFDIYIVLTSEKDDGKRKNARQAHIDVWSDILPHKKVMAAFALSEQIAPYYYLLAYRRVELNAPPQSRWELSFLLLRFVRKILEQTKVGDTRPS